MSANEETTAAALPDTCEESMRHKLEMMNVKVAELNLLLKEKNHELFLSTGRSDELERELYEAKAEYERTFSEVEKCRKMVSRHNALTTKLLLRLEERDDEINGLRQECRSLTKERDDLRQQIDVLSRRIAEVRAERTQKTAETETHLRETVAVLQKRLKAEESKQN